MSDSTIRIEDDLKQSYLTYAMSVLTDRALPDVRDGLKPVHRRIIHAMNSLKLDANKDSYKKAARVVGDTMGRWHPHGDTSIYDALVIMSQPWKTKALLVDFQGNNGSIDGDKAAAQRYPEVKKTLYTELMIKDIEKDTVDFIANFAEEPGDEEPTVLPARYPNLLVNGTYGIAVGMASSIPPHNFNEAMNAVIALLNNEDITIEELVEKYIPAPDFPFGGTIINQKDMLDCYKTGNGKAVIRADYTINEKTKTITFNNIPFGENKSAVFSKMLQVFKDDVIPSISKIEDNSGENIMVKIDVTYKNGSDPKDVVEQLYMTTPLQSNYSFNMNGLVDGEPKKLDLKMMLYYYTKHLIEVHKRAINFDLTKLKNRLHVLYGYKIILEDIDNVIELIKKSTTPSAAVKNLMDKYNLTEIQGKAVVELKLGRITSLEIEKVQKEIDEKEQTVAFLEGLLADKNKLKSFIIDDINTTVKEMNVAQRITKLDNIAALSKSKAAKTERLIIEEDTYVFLDDKGMLKRCKKQLTGKTIKNSFSAKTTDYFLAFTASGGVTKILVDDVKEVTNATGIGQKPETIDAQDLIIYVSPLNYDYIAHITKDNLIKKSEMSEFRSITKPNIKSVNLSEGDEIKSILSLNKDDTILCMNDKGFILKFKESDVRPTGRVTKGMKAMLDGIIIGGKVVVADDEFSKKIKLESRGKKGVTLKQ